ncbi:MAG: ribbon-helix-helix domain-containing protein [Rickettsiales bacterium]|jgi:predicted DNA-binding ribbon-helix-helix protein|nr:ribbon-helix-helix domain-containing protein [Rickettsiales bacterium]
MKKISVSLQGHQTSISLEKEFVDILKKMAKIDKVSVAAIINSIDAKRDPDSNLSSEIRIWILRKLLKTAKL